MEMKQQLIDKIRNMKNKEIILICEGKDGCGMSEVATQIARRFVNDETKK